MSPLELNRNIRCIEIVLRDQIYFLKQEVEPQHKMY